MLFFIGPLAVFAFVTFLNVSTWYRGKWGPSTSFGLLWASISLLIFGLLIPGVATYQSEDRNVRYTQTIDGEITAGITGHNGTAVLNYSTAEEGVASVATDGDYFSVIREDIDEPIIRYMCDETPDWAAPYTFGGCGPQFVLPHDYVLELH